MGMDVYGEKPKSKVGTYFRRNVWGWRPLANYILEAAPGSIIDKCQYWHSNDGDGLPEEQAEELAEFLTGEIESGRAESYVEMRKACLESMPDSECEHCKGTGQRDDQYVKGKCNACQGLGKVRPFETWYDVTLEDIMEFRDFLAASGGFKIY